MCDALFAQIPDLGVAGVDLVPEHSIIIQHPEILRARSPVELILSPHEIILTIASCAASTQTSSTVQRRSDDAHSYRCEPEDRL